MKSKQQKALAATEAAAQRAAQAAAAAAASEDEGDDSAGGSSSDDDAAGRGGGGGGSNDEGVEEYERRPRGAEKEIKGERQGLPIKTLGGKLVYEPQTQASLRASQVRGGGVGCAAAAPLLQCTR